MTWTRGFGELSAKGDDLERVNALVDFEAFRSELEQAVPRADRAKGGRPPYDHVLMFRTLILQASHSLSDERTEYLIKDRLSFMRFLGLSLADPAGADREVHLVLPEALTRARIGGVPAIEALFRRFEAQLSAAGYIAMGGQIIDATVVAAPKQRNTEDEKRALSRGPDTRGRGEEAREALPEGSRRALDGEILQGQAIGGRRETRRHRHPDVRLQEPCRHRPPPRADPHLDRNRRRPPRRRATARPARQDQHRELGLGRHRVSLGEERGAPRGQGLHQPDPPKKPMGKPMPKNVSRANAAKSEVRAHVEHVFARQKGPMALVIRTIGLARATVKIGLANLVYNMRRMVWLAAPA